ncbi:hypothetical protein Pint_25780 [Pistacia integerrima]|uniref:Uncharacterized protein n=1 Tax=Pistacia integerrima TaxID=434235 RepID=A0ACC0YE77_9ROSI|nr:hypothetical protein Pint_25780 [Pistacia integerrima]
MTKLPDNIGQLSFLETLFLRGNNFESIPKNIKGLSKLRWLDISNCRRLRLLPELPMGVSVYASDCSSLQSISDPSFLLLPHWRRRRTTFANCFKLDLSKILHEESCREFCAHICFPGDEIPKWFTFQNTGSYIPLDQSLDWHNKNFLGFLASINVVFPYEYIPYNMVPSYSVTCYCLVKSEDGKEQIYRIGTWEDRSGRAYRFPIPKHILSDHVLFSFHSITEFVFKELKYNWQHDRICYEMMTSSNCKVLIKFDVEGAEVKKCGIHFLYNEDYGEPLEISRRSVDSAKKKGNEKEKDELQSNKLQISNPFDGMCNLRPHFMSNCPSDLECLEARYWKLKRNALREIVKDALLNSQQNNILCTQIEEVSLLS